MKTARPTHYIQDERVIMNGNGFSHDQDHFVQRFSHLPMVALTLSRLTEVYQKTKVQNALLKLALEKGEETLLMSLAMAAAIANKTGLQGPLNAADSSACYLLNKVEEKLPIITYTPDEIVYNTKRMYDDTVRSKITQLNCMKDHAVRKLSDAKQFGVDKLEGARTLGTSTVKNMVEMPVGKVNQSVEWSLNTADVWMDKLLPEGENGRYVSDYHTTNLDHAKVLSSKLRTRLRARIADNNRTANLLSQALSIIESLKSTSAATSLNQIMSRIRRLSAHLTTNDNARGYTNGHASRGEVNEGNVRARALSLVKKLSRELVEKMEGMVMGGMDRVMPQPMKEKMERMVEMSRDVLQQVSEAHTIDELPQSFVGQVHTYVHSLHVTMNSALDVLTDTYLLKWLVPEYNNIGSLDIHIQ